MSRALETYKAIAKYSDHPFEYGRLDCVLFFGKVYEEVTGQDLYSGFEYFGEEQAYSIIDKHGGLKELIDRVIGKPATRDLVKLQPGAPILLSFPKDMLGVKTAIDTVAVRSMNRVIELPLTRCKYGWDI